MVFEQIKQFFGYGVEEKAQPKDPFSELAVGSAEQYKDDIFKAYIPGFIYRPPYGWPRKVNTIMLKELAKNPYIFSVIKTLYDEATSVGWEIAVKEEYNDDGKDYSDKIKEITRFFDNPNGNKEPFENILKSVITDICEVDSGVIVKVFNTNGELQQIFARDGSLFLKNPNIYGFIGDRAAFVPPLPDGFNDVRIDISATGIKNPANPNTNAIIQRYNLLYQQDAAYFQYGFTAGSLPVPFGKREIVYMMANPRADNIYGRSPIEILAEIIQVLVYGSEANLDFFTNNQMPEGVIQLLGGQPEHIKQFRENFRKNFQYTNSIGKKQKRFFQVPIATTEVKYTPFQLSPKEMEIITQQEWFTKVLWMCFGVTANEMGFTEQVNKSVGEEQSKVAKRKALKPMLQTISYHLNQEILPEFFLANDPEAGGSKQPLDFSDIPIEFKFTDYDYEEDKKKHDLLEQELRMGVKTSDMVAKELGINIKELEESRNKEIELQNKIAQQQQEQQPQNEGGSVQSDNQNENAGQVSAFTQENQKSLLNTKADLVIKPQKPKTVTREVKKDSRKELKDIDAEIDELGEQVLEAISRIPENIFQQQ